MENYSVVKKNKHCTICSNMDGLSIWKALSPGGSGGKESACNTGDLGLIPGLGRPLEEGMTMHSRILAWRVPMDRGAWWAAVHGVAKSRTRLSD